MNAAAPPSTGPCVPDTLTPDLSLGNLMRKALASIRSQVDLRLAPCDLTYTQWMPLYQ